MEGEADRAVWEEWEQKIADERIGK
jgi:hypothetical protein